MSARAAPENVSFSTEMCYTEMELDLQILMVLTNNGFIYFFLRIYEEIFAKKFPVTYIVACTRFYI